MLLHDGLLVSPLPTQSTLARLHNEALHLVGLRSDDTSFLRITSLVDTYTQTIRQLPPTSSHDTQALHVAIAAVNLEHLRQTPAVPQTLGRNTTPPPPFFCHGRLKGLSDHRSPNENANHYKAN